MRNKLCIISIMTLAIAGLGFTKVPTMPNNTVMADVVDDDRQTYITTIQPIIDNNNGNAFENETTTSYVTEQPTISTDSKDTVVRKAPTIKAKKTKFTIKKKKGKKIKKVKNGTRVYVIHKIPNTGWYKVKVKGKTGYMKALKFKVKKRLMVIMEQQVETQGVGMLLLMVEKYTFQKVQVVLLKRYMKDKESQHRKMVMIGDHLGNKSNFIIDIENIF